ncbi:hypothetical protein GF342_05955 [Candidatus Woesearchaeota archaeon]|nr:hypothetical protein [Candidatus Woesearchaeota archaeon]
MVSPLDVGLLQTFQVVFPFIFVLTAVFAFLTQVPPFKENYLYAALMAVALAVLTMFSPIAIKTINVMAPWFVLLFVAIIFALLAYYIVGHNEESLRQAIHEGEYSSTLGWWIFALILIIVIGSLTSVISQEQGFTDLTADNVSSALQEGPEEQAGFFQVILHPKVLGMAVILLIAFFAIGQLSKKSEK